MNRETRKPIYVEATFTVLKNFRKTKSSYGKNQVLTVLVHTLFATKTSRLLHRQVFSN